MKLVLLCPFDPVTKKEIEYAKKVLKESKSTEIYLMPWGKGICTLQERKEILKVTLQSYKKLRVCDAIEKEDQVVCFEEAEKSEEKVHHGDFTKLEEKTRKYVCEKGYYYKEVAKNMCKPSRYAHSLRVADTCVLLAKAHHYDENRAYKAGILHDITKAYSYEESEKIISAYKPEWLSISEKVWHSFTAVVFLKQHMQYVEEDVLHAIEHHTLGDGNTDLDAILYIADKIEPGRGHDTSYHMALACKDLKAAVKYIQEESLRYRQEKEGK